MAEHYDRIVVGGGAMGLAAAWQLAERGTRVLLLERFEAGHHRGASHGATRNINNGYTLPHYVELYTEAVELWRTLEAQSGRELLVLSGMVSHGDAHRIEAAHHSLRERGLDSAMLEPRDASVRWRGMRFTGPVLYNRTAGRINAALGLEVLAELAQRAGAELRYEHQVTGIARGTAAVEVTAVDALGTEHRITGDEVVVAVGAWSAPLLAGLVPLPPLEVTEEHPAHFTIRDTYADANWPSFNHYLRAIGEQDGNRGNVYGMFTPGEGVKVGFHRTGEAVDPDARRFRASDAGLRPRASASLPRWWDTRPCRPRQDDQQARAQTRTAHHR